MPGSGSARLLARAGDSSGDEARLALVWHLRKGFMTKNILPRNCHDRGSCLHRQELGPCHRQDEGPSTRKQAGLPETPRGMLLPTLLPARHKDVHGPSFSRNKR